MTEETERKINEWSMMLSEMDDDTDFDWTVALAELEE